MINGLTNMLSSTLCDGCVCVCVREREGGRVSVCMSVCVCVECQVQEIDRVWTDIAQEQKISSGIVGKRFKERLE